MRVSPWQAGVVVVVLTCGGACDVPPPVDADPSRSVSAGDMFPGDNSLEYYQSEQSVIRAIDAITREPLLVVGFNDGAGEFDASGRPLIEKNRMGYARIADSASAWIYGRVPVLSATPGHRVTTANGDPWLATNRSRDRIYYANLGLGSGAGSNAPNALLVSVHDDGATSGFWRAPFTGGLDPPESA